MHASVETLHCKYPMSACCNFDKSERRRTSLKLLRYSVHILYLHLTTSKVMVIVWRLRGNIIRTVLYIANVLPLQWAQLTKIVHTTRFGLEFVFLFLGCMICLCVGVCFVLPWTVESFELISLHVVALA